MRPSVERKTETRNTRQRQLVLSLLREAGEPLTAGELYERAVKRQPTLAKSTVYRNLDALLERGEIAHGLLDSGESFYTAAYEGEHRHYMVCKGCNRLFDLPECPLESMERELRESVGFEVTDHVVQVYGYCAACRTDRKRPL